MHWSEFDGILFIEGEPFESEIIGRANCTLHGIFTQSQLKNLNDVKSKLACEVKRKGGNALVNFRYGQKSSFWTTLIGIDNILWYGEGDIVSLPIEKIEELRYNNK